MRVQTCEQRLIQNDTSVRPDGEHAYAACQWHKFCTSVVAAPPGVLFEPLADMPGCGRWLPGSKQFGKTTDVEPYPVQLGSRHHDGKLVSRAKNGWAA